MKTVLSPVRMKTTFIFGVILGSLVVQIMSMEIGESMDMPPGMEEEAGMSMGDGTDEGSGGGSEEDSPESIEDLCEKTHNDPTDDQEIEMDGPGNTPDGCGKGNVEDMMSESGGSGEMGSESK